MARILVFLVLLTAGAWAQSHYLPGSFPTKALTTLPPGLSFSQVFMNYRAAAKIPQTDGSSLFLGSDTSAALELVQYNTGLTFLGAEYGFYVGVPLQNVGSFSQLTGAEFTGTGTFTQGFGMGDLVVCPLMLGWHGDRYDALFTYTFYAPTGSAQFPPATSVPNVGRGFWTHQLQGGITGYLDDERSWGLSLSGCYEVNSRLVSPVDFRQGSQFTLDYGLTRQVSDEVSVGLVGYSSWQVSDNTGSQVALSKNAPGRNSVNALGAELSFRLPDSDNLTFTLRHLREYGALYRFQGNLTELVISVPLGTGSEAPASPEPEASPED